MKLAVKRSLKGILLLLSLVVVLIGGRLALGMLLKPAPHVLSPEEALRARALELQHDIIVVDGHNHISTFILDFGFDLGMDGDEPDDRSPGVYAFGSLTWLPNPPHGDEVRTHTDLARACKGPLVWRGGRQLNPGRRDAGP